MPAKRSKNPEFEGSALSSSATIYKLPICSWRRFSGSKENTFKNLSFLFLGLNWNSNIFMMRMLYYRRLLNFCPKNAIRISTVCQNEVFLEEITDCNNRHRGKRKKLAHWKGSGNPWR